MKVLQEITDWGDENVPNHTYFINDAGKCVGYINALTGIKEMFKKPLRFEKTRRKFKEIK